MKIVAIKCSNLCVVLQCSYCSFLFSVCFAVFMLYLLPPCRIKMYRPIHRVRKKGHNILGTTLTEWVLRMVHAKSYETVSTLVKVMQRKLWPLFSGHGIEVRPTCAQMLRSWFALRGVWDLRVLGLWVSVASLLCCCNRGGQNDGRFYMSRHQLSARQKSISLSIDQSSS